MRPEAGSDPLSAVASALVASEAEVTHAAKFGFAHPGHSILTCRFSGPLGSKRHPSSTASSRHCCVAAASLRQASDSTKHSHPGQSQENLAVMVFMGCLSRQTADGGRYGVRKNPRCGCKGMAIL